MALLCLAVVPAPAIAQFQAYFDSESGLDGRWNVPLNWLNDALPPTNADIIIGSQNDDDLHGLNQDFIIRSLTIDDAQFIALDANSAGAVFPRSIFFQAVNGVDPSIVVTSNTINNTYIGGYLTGPSWRGKIDITIPASKVLTIDLQKSGGRTNLYASVNGFGSILKVGPGTLAMGQTPGGGIGFADSFNRYSLGTELNAGTIVVLRSTAMSGSSIDYGPIGTGALVIDGNSTAFGCSGSQVIANPVFIGANTTLFAGSSLSSLTLGGAINLSAPSSTSVTRTLTTINSVFMTGVVTNGSGTGGILKQGSGSLILSAANSFSGPLTASVGRLVLTHPQAFGPGTGGSGDGTSIANGAQLRFTTAFGNSTVNEEIRINGVGPAGEGIVVNPKNATTTKLRGPIVLSGNSTISIFGNASLTADGGVKSNNTQTRNLALAGSGTFRHNRTNRSRVNFLWAPGSTVVLSSYIGTNYSDGRASTELAAFGVSADAVDVSEDDIPPTGSLPTLKLEDEGSFASEIETGTTSFTLAVDTGTFAGAVNGAIYGNGAIVKRGTGALTAQHVRTGSLSIEQGSVKSASLGADAGTSRLGFLTIAGGAAPSAKLDLTNNDLVLDYTTTSPVGNPTSGSETVAQWIKAGWNGGGSGAWQGNGITTSAGKAGSFAVAYAEASNVLTFSGGTATFSGQTVDASTALAKYSYYGDASLDGWVNLDDYTRLSASYGYNNKIWQDGDFNYDGSINLDDYTILSATYGSGTQLRGSGGALPPLAELYVAMLDNPQIYWDARSSPSLWERFAPFEALNLGPIPPIPAGLRNSIPEPAGGAIVLCLFAALKNRVRGRLLV